MSEPKRLRDSRTIKVGEAITYEIPWWKYLGHVWRDGERFIATSFVRPTRPNGYEYECTVAGQTASREPTWPTTAGLTVVDGSATWTCRAIGNSAVDTISTSNWTGMTGLTIANPQIDATKQLTSARISGAKLGQKYEVIDTIITAAGDTYIFTLEIEAEA